MTDTRNGSISAQLAALAQLLIERVVIADGGLEIIWRDQGWQELAGMAAKSSCRHSSR